MRENVGSDRGHAWVREMKTGQWRGPCAAREFDEGLVKVDKSDK